MRGRGKRRTREKAVIVAEGWPPMTRTQRESVRSRHAVTVATGVVMFCTKLLVLDSEGLSE